MELWPCAYCAPSLARLPDLLLFLFQLGLERFAFRFAEALAFRFDLRGGEKRDLDAVRLERLVRQRFAGQRISFHRLFAP